MAFGMMVKVAFVAAALLVGIGSRFLCRSCLKDSVVEEVCEEIIHDATGINIDLSPESEEQN